MTNLDVADKLNAINFMAINIDSIDYASPILPKNFILFRRNYN